MRRMEARLALWRGSRFDMVPQRMIGIIDHLIDCLDICRPTRPLRLSVQQLSLSLARNASSIVDTLTWLEEFEYAKLSRNGDIFVVELLPAFLDPLGLSTCQRVEGSSDKINAKCVMHRICG